jgi:hypothetical protein
MPPPFFLLYNWEEKGILYLYSKNDRDGSTMRLRIVVVLCIGVFLFSACRADGVMNKTDLSSQATPLTARERFEQLTNRPLPEWTTADFEELLSMSNDDLNIDLEEHYGGRNFVFGIIGASIDFPNEASNLSGFDYPRGYLKYATEYAEDGELLYPSLLTLGYAPKDKLLGADLGGTLGDIMDVFGEADIEYVVRVNGGVKAQVYFVRYNIDGLVFLFECAINGELTELPPHPPLPTREEIVSSKIDNVHILKEDSVLLEQLDARPTTQTILRNFNWMASLNGGEERFADKPFLSINAKGSDGAAGLLDIDRDGVSEFLLSVNHIPRGVASVEVFALKDDHLQSIGGFFEAREKPPMLSYYRDSGDRLLFLQETQAQYGRYTNILVATYVDDFRSVPIVGERDYYGLEGTEIYYIFPSDETFDCTNEFVSGGFEDQYTVSKEEYDQHLLQYKNSLTWVEDVSYEYCVSYPLENYQGMVYTIRYEEFDKAIEEKDYDRFQTEEEYKKTSDMVADALYAAYLSYSP